MSESVKQYRNFELAFDEKLLAQIPALQLLIKLGFEYLGPQQLDAERQGKQSHVLLETILCDQLRRINHIHYKGQRHPFSEENIQAAIDRIKTTKVDRLQKTNEAIYDLLTLGTALSQAVEGDSRNFNFNYIDWNNPQRNCFHVDAGFNVERTRSSRTAQADIVLFVNGIPLVVIDCVSPYTELHQAINQSIRHQAHDCIPGLFTFTQLVIGINNNNARYATAGTAERFWSVWQELDDSNGQLASLVKQTLTNEQQQQLFSGEFATAQTYFTELANTGERTVTAQDQTLYSLCRPERLLELAFKFTVFENGVKKIARYQQYFVIKSTLQRIKQFDAKGRRQGGMIWHTQGSGKTLSMVMLVRNLLLQSDIPNPRIVLVTDRDDLDRQLANTFTTCGLGPYRATSGRHLLELVSELKAGIVTTLIQKFDKAMNIKKYQDESADIFMLVDESHRSNFGLFAARMRQMFSHACYLGFTGTPLLKKEKNNFARFGGLIEPHYSINQAVQDGAVVPLLYEARHIEMAQDMAAIDLWFERHTQGLSGEQVALLKKRYASASMLNKTEQVVYMRALDISEHFRTTWQGTGFKGQLVAPNKQTALLYQQYLYEIGHVSSEVVISAPDEKEGIDDETNGPAASVVKFWQQMMRDYGNREEYEKQIINQFKNGATPEILIVVSKLLTGFDAPRNTVLYLCSTLKEHTLLQAVARVNRLYEDKEFGFIVDYVSALGELDKALNMYSAFVDFDAEDIAGTLASVHAEIDNLPQVYSDLKAIFKGVKDLHDVEQWKILFADATMREDFYQRLHQYGKTLAIALSSDQFVNQIDDATLQAYKNDLKEFYQLKTRVKLRFAQNIDKRDFEPKIKKLLDTYIQANQVIPVSKPVNIFDDQSYTAIKEGMVHYNSGSPADRAEFIAHTTKRVITEKLQQEPVIFNEFSNLIANVIGDYDEKRITDIEYLDQILLIQDKLATRQHEVIPISPIQQERALAIYRTIKPIFHSSADGKIH